MVVFAQLNSGYGTSIELLSSGNIITIQKAMNMGIYT